MKPKGYDKFLKQVDYHDKDSGCYRFIQGVYALGQENYTDALDELNAACKKIPGCIPFLRVRALAYYKKGDMVGAQKIWQATEHLLASAGSASTVSWMSGVTSKMKRSWHDSIKAQGEGRVVHPTVVIVALIDKSGQVTQALVTQSSGNKNFDELTKDACLNASPVEPPPEGLNLPVKIRINFDQYHR